MPLERMKAWCLENGIVLDAAQMNAFQRFQQSLYEVNLTTNLTRVPFQDCEVRHFLDSLLVAPFIPFDSRVLDIGTGPGFPAWPLACARPDLNVTALDSTSKMVRFLSKNTLPNLVVHQCRAEEFEQREVFDVVTGRAVAPVAVQLEISAGPCLVGGKLILFRTPGEANDCKKFPAKILGLALEELKYVLLPDTDVTRLFPIYRKLAKTPDEFPRPWAAIKGSSL